MAFQTAGTCLLFKSGLKIVQIFYGTPPKLERWEAEHQEISLFTCHLYVRELISQPEGLSIAVYGLKTHFPIINAKHNCNNSTTDHEEIDLAITT